MPGTPIPLFIVLFSVVVGIVGFVWKEKKNAQFSSREQLNPFFLFSLYSLPYVSSAFHLSIFELRKEEKMNDCGCVWKSVFRVVASEGWHDVCNSLVEWISKTAT